MEWELLSFSQDSPETVPQVPLTRRDKLAKRRETSVTACELLLALVVP